jgi:hypothetical protein
MLIEAAAMEDGQVDRPLERAAANNGPDVLGDNA